MSPILNSKNNFISVSAKTTANLPQIRSSVANAGKPPYEGLSMASSSSGDNGILSNLS